MKWPGHEIKPSPHLNEQTKNEWRHTSTLPYVLKFAQEQLYMYRNRQVFEASHPYTAHSVEWNSFHEAKSRSGYQITPHILWKQEIFPF
jgi:hypothetical protein